MGKVYTHFQTKTEQKPTWWVGGGALTFIASKGVLPPFLVRGPAATQAANEQGTTVGYDNISMNLIKESIYTTICPLSRIINLSITCVCMCQKETIFLSVIFGEHC